MIVVLWTDALVFLLIAALAAFAFYARGKEHWLAPWREVARKPLGMSALMILLAYVTIGLLDSIHFRSASQNKAGEVVYDAAIESVLDVVLTNLRDAEKTYSRPFAIHSLAKETIEDEQGGVTREYPRLRHAGAHLSAPHDHHADIARRIGGGVASGLLLWAASIAAVVLLIAWRTRAAVGAVAQAMLHGRGVLPWRSMFATWLFIALIVCVFAATAGVYHVFGTDKVGEDVLYQAIKSIRTGLVIGTLTTLIMLPFAVLLGIMAGYLKGWVDDVIQYIYTTLNSIPGVLLIAATVLVMLAYMETHPDLFATGVERADFRLLFLCVILGITSWTGLCRLLRAETLKLGELEYVQAAEALGISRLKIILRHILPNCMHIILIAVVLDFSGLVLAEAVLSYLNIGVDPTMYSWGNMINSSRLELAREPIVWWSFLAAFLFMFLLVLSANLFCDAFDPRLREAHA